MEACKCYSTRKKNGDKGLKCQKGPGAHCLWREKYDFFPPFRIKRSESELDLGKKEIAQQEKVM